MRYANIFIGVCILCSEALGAQANITIDGLVDTIQAAGGSINDLTIEYEMRVEYSDIESKIKEASTPGQEFLLCKGTDEIELKVMKPFREFYREHVKSEFADTDGKTGKDDRVNTYNGRQGKTYIIREAIGLSGKPLHSAIVTNGPIDEGWNVNRTPIGYIGAFRLESFEGKVVDLPEYLRLVRDESKRDRLDLVTEIQKINDCNAISIRHWRRVNRHDNGEEIDLPIATYYFSVDHNFNLVRYEVMRGLDGVAWRKDVFRSERLSNGVWFPMECEFRDLAPDGTANIFKVTKVAVNQGLTEKDFDVTFPPGTSVTDRITGERYVVKPTQEQLDKTLPAED